MKNGRIGMAIAAGLALTSGSAWAGDFVETDWFSVATDLSLGASEGIQTTVEVPTNDSLIVGFQVRFDYSEPVADASWASDVQVIVTSPAGDSYTVGGLTNLPAADEGWSFQGPESDGPGVYGDTDLDIFIAWEDNPQDKGTWTIDFINDWAGDPNANEYAYVDIKFFKIIPTPGALALFGVAGLAGRRRRRH